jgi:hypothetical protein
MKLNRTQFKKILKECITELIQEGAFDKVVSENLQTTPRVAANDLVSNAAFGGPYGNAPESTQEQNDQESAHPFENVGQLTPNRRLQEVARLTAARTSKGDPKAAQMLTAIFEDTAMTTLQRDIAHGAGGRGSNAMFVGEQDDPAVDAVDKAELDALSNGMGASHWAAIAFGKQKKR